MTFVQATYVLATFVHIRNISAVPDPIETKLFEQNITFYILRMNKEELTIGNLGWIKEI